MGQTPKRHTSRQSRKSRQWRWAQKQRRLGKCRSCGAKRNQYAWLCDSCQLAVRERERAKRTTA